MPNPLCARAIALALPLVLTSPAHTAQAPDKDELAKYIREHYVKQEHRIPMRDGVRLFTTIYLPKDGSQKVPMLMTRTPYSVGPYGPDKMRNTLGPNRHF